MNNSANTGPPELLFLLVIWAVIVGIGLARKLYPKVMHALIGREIVRLKRARLVLLTARRMERNHARAARNAQADTNSGGCNP